MANTNDTDAAAPAATPTPAKKLPSFKRGGAAPAPAADPASSEGDTTNDGASSEQTNAADALAVIDYDAAAATSSEGLHSGKIVKIAPTKNGNGFRVSVAHKDGSIAGLNILPKSVVKVNGQPKIDQATGKIVMEDNLRGAREWAEFARAFGQNPQELARQVIDLAAGRTAEKPAIVGIEAMWDFKSTPPFLNCTFNAEATAAMGDDADDAE